VPREDAVKELRRRGIVLDDERRPILFFPGRADVGKGDDYIAQICESLSEEYPDFLVLTTSDSDSPKQHPNITHIGWQESTRLKYLYSAADLTLLLSKLPESFSQVCIESVACGTPVLAFPFGNLSELSKSLSAISTCEPTKESIINSIRQLLTDPERDNALEESRAAIEKNYSIDDIGRTYIQLYLDIAKRRRECLHIPEIYFLSPFAVVRGGKAYLSNNDGIPLKSYDLTEDELTVLACCTSAISIDEIRLTTGLNYDTIRSTLNMLAERKVITGGRHGSNARH
jgi:hypothetical protein